MAHVNRLHQVLVVGCGSIGERHARCFQATKRCTVSICDPLADRRKQLMQRYAFQSEFINLEAALQATWDAAIIATPAPFHIPQATELAARGISVLIEKPLSTGIGGVKELMAVARERDVTLGVAYVLRAHPAVMEVRRRLLEAEFGSLKLVTAIGGQHFPTYRPDYREIYYAHRETGGGAIQDALTHLADLVHHLAGQYTRVQCDQMQLVLDGVEVEDTATVLARLVGAEGRQVMATLSCNQFQAPNETRVDLHGEYGSVRIDLTRHRYGVFRRGDLGWTWSKSLLVERDELFIRQANSFLDAMEGGTAPLCTLEDALHTLRFNLAALEAGDSGRSILIPAS